MKQKIYELQLQLQQEIEREYPSNRERSLAITSLELVGMWLTRADKVDMAAATAVDTK